MEKIYKKKSMIIAIIIWSLILIIIFLMLKFRLYKATIVELDGPTAYINIEKYYISTIISFY